MSTGLKRVVFYHSVICPRCHMSGLALRRVLKNRPDVEVTKVELLKNMGEARRAGVKSIPTLVADGRRLTGILLTPGRIDRFFASLQTEKS